MLNIAICDDDHYFLSISSDYIRKWADNKKIHVTIYSFDNGDDLLKKQELITMDIVVLDVIMPLLNGIETASDLRLINPSACIVFLTTSRDFALESYSVKADNYLLKPVAYSTFAATLSDCYEKLHRSEKRLLLKTSSSNKIVFLRDILYVEAQNKHVEVHLKNDKILSILQPFYTLEDSLLMEECFYKCHRSYIVNLSSIASFTVNSIVMETGEILPISRGIYRDFNEAYFSYMFK